MQGRQTTPHFKLKERENKPEDEWIRVEDTHEAIVERHDFDLVQRIKRIDTRTSPKENKVYLFSGILICGCCGCRMTRKTNHYKGREYHYYYCPTGKKGGCNGSVMLKEEDLIECVRDSLKGHIDNVASWMPFSQVSARNGSTGSWPRNMLGRSPPMKNAWQRLRASRQSSMRTLSAAF